MKWREDRHWPWWTWILGSLLSVGAWIADGATGSATALELRVRRCTVPSSFSCQGSACSDSAPAPPPSVSGKAVPNMYDHYSLCIMIVCSHVRRMSCAIVILRLSSSQFCARCHVFSPFSSSQVQPPFHTFHPTQMGRIKGAKSGRKHGNRPFSAKFGWGLLANSAWAKANQFRRTAWIQILSCHTFHRQTIVNVSET